jgi:hypothetical protein
MTEKKPQPGEWWEYRENYDCRVFMIGQDHLGRMIAINQYLEFEVFDEQGDMAIQWWRHIPECDSFDWKPPVEEFPQYWTTVDTLNDPAAFVRRDCLKRMTIFYKDGTNEQFEWHSVEQRCRLTEAEAMALLPKPTESPDDWVTQDIVSVRPSLDEVGYSGWDDDDRWVPATGNWSDYSSNRHGMQTAIGTLRVRCRRKDLPKRGLMEEVIPGPAIAYDSVGRSEALREGDLLLDGNMAFKVPSALFGKTPDTAILPGGMVTHFLRPKKNPEPKPATIDPVVLEVLAHMRDQVAAMSKRVESLERNLAFRGPL